MKTINTININNGKNEVVNSYIQLFMPHAVANEVIQREFKPQVQELQTQATRFATCLEDHRFSLLTENVVSMDTRRDKKWTAAKAVLVAQQENTDPGLKKAAETVNRLFDSFGKIRNMSYAEQSGAMSSLCNDLLNNHLEELQLLSLVPLIQDLKAANEDFIRAYEERTESMAAHDKGETREAKMALITAYRTLIFLLNAWIMQHGSDGLDEFIAYTNTLIRQYRPMVGQKPAPSEDESLEEGLEDEELDGVVDDGDNSDTTPPSTEPTTPPTTEPSNPGNGENGGGQTGGNGSGSTGGGGSTETPTDPTKILLLFNDGAHGNVIVKRMEVEPGYQLKASDLPAGYVYAFKADDQADIDAASPGDTVWVTLAPRG